MPLSFRKLVYDRANNAILQGSCENEPSTESLISPSRKLVKVRTDTSQFTQPPFLFRRFPQADAKAGLSDVIRHVHAVQSGFGFPGFKGAAPLDSREAIRATYRRNVGWPSETMPDE